MNYIRNFFPGVYRDITSFEGGNLIVSDFCIDGLIVDYLKSLDCNVLIFDGGLCRIRNVFSDDKIRKQINVVDFIEKYGFSSFEEIAEFGSFYLHCEDSEGEV